MKHVKRVFMTIGLLAAALFPLSAQAAPGQGQPFQDLQEQVDKLAQDQATGDQGLRDQIEQEVQDRIAGDQDLQGQINQEVQDRVAGDQSLQDQIDQEVQDRVAGDESLQDQIGQEAQERAVQDQSIRDEMEQLWGWISRSSLYTRSSESVDCSNQFCFVSVECDTPCDIPFHGYCTHTASLGKFEVTSEGFTGLSGSSAMPGYSCVGETVDGFSSLRANVVCLQSPAICVY